MSRQKHRRNFQPKGQIAFRNDEQINCSRHLSCINSTDEQLKPKCSFQGSTFDYLNGLWLPVLHFDKSVPALEHLSKYAYLYQDDCDSGKQLRCHIAGDTACRKKSLDILKYQWIPNSCILEPFNPDHFGQLLRDKTVLFVGDSLMRQQYNSLRFLLGYQVHDTSLQPECFTLSGGTRFCFLWSKYLVNAQEILKQSDILDTNALLLNETWFNILTNEKIDYMIMSVGHHWHKIDKHFEKYDATVRAVLQYLKNNFKGKAVYYRTSSSGHYGCDKPEKSQILSQQQSYTRRIDRYRWQIPIQKEVIWHETASELGLSFFKVLNISNTNLRPDGHIEYKIRKNIVEDCLHWCLPGIPDFWNLFLYNAIKEEGINK
jgi:hypothetical protein